MVLKIVFYLFNRWRDTVSKARVSKTSQSDDAKNDVTKKASNSTQDPNNRLFGLDDGVDEQNQVFPDF